MTDPITIQAELDAREDIHRDERHRLALENAALRVEVAHLTAELEAFRRATTIPAPPLTEWPQAAAEGP